jgi:uncharacterized membrane protein (UPF0127 family)
MLRLPVRTSLIAIVVLFTAVLQSRAASKPTGEEPLIPIITPGGITILAELADTAEKRGRGLMFRDSLAKDRGMLFTFHEPQQWTFWMKNTRIPLDIIWMDEKKKIVHVERHVPTCSRTDDGCPQYQPNDQAMYVLELAAGMADSLQLQRGTTLRFQVAGRS